MVLKIKKHIVSVSLVLVALSSYAQQDPQYTQYMYNTNNVNPAYAGSREALSIFGLYRTQWVGLDGAPDTGVFSIHSPVGERVGLGLTFVNDRISISDESTISIDFSYTIPLSDRYKLGFGLKTTAHLLNVDYSKLNLHDQGDIAMSNINNKFSPNIGAGIYLYSDKFYVGFSAPNIIETEHYNNDDVQSLASERIHSYLISGYVFDLTEGIKFKPAILAKMVEGSPLQADITGNFLFNEKFVLGVAWRWSEAISGLAGFQINDNWFIGYAYDAETTKLANYNSGSHEIFLRYEFFNKSKRMVSPRFF
ncbi:MAG: type IX secretion system membrane protein PorP/SprF [Flavobacteriaceae bacterium]